MIQTFTLLTTLTFPSTNKPAMHLAMHFTALVFPCFVGCLSCASTFSGPSEEQPCLDMVKEYVNQSSHNFGYIQKQLLSIGQRGSPRFFAYLGFGVGAPIGLTFVSKMKNQLFLNHTS